MCTIDIASSTVIPCSPLAWWSFSVRPRQGRISARLPCTMWLRLSLVLTCTVSSQLRSASNGVREVRGGEREVAAQGDEYLHLAACASPRSSRTVPSPCSRGGSKPQTSPSRSRNASLGTVVDPAGAVALHVAVAADRARPRPFAADVAAQEQQVDDLANRVDAVLVLRDAEAPSDDHALRRQVASRRACGSRPRQRPSPRRAQPRASASTSAR